MGLPGDPPYGARTKPSSGQFTRDPGDGPVVSTALFVRLLKASDRAKTLAGALTAFRTGHISTTLHVVDQNTFRMLPRAPFAYWVSDAMRRKFVDLSPLKKWINPGPRSGAKTNDDPR